MVAVAGVEGDNGRDVFSLPKAVDAQGILAAVIDGGMHLHGELMGGSGLEQSMQTGWSHGEVGVMGWLDEDLPRQGMVLRHDTVLEVAMAEEVGITVRIIAPGGGGVTVEAFVVAAKDAVGAAVAGRTAMGTGTGR
jgi:hypothetical protein